MLYHDRSLSVPHIATELPGPEARRVIESDEQVTSPSYTRAYPLVAARGRGAMIEDVDGNRFLDFTAGIAVCATGHCHPRVVEAITEQAQELLHMSGTDFYYVPQRDLARRLADLVPGESRQRVFFSNSGAEAVEAALKLARHHTRRRHLVGFFGGFHGRTMGALSMTASKAKQRGGFAPLVPEVSHVQYPNPYRGVTVDDTLAQIEELFRRTVPADEVAAILVEPIQGEGGYIVPPHDFLPRLKELAGRHGILLIADEVQSGMGRTGRMFAVDHVGVEPDIICLAKGIASGMPLGAIVARADVMDWPPGAHASTFGGNPVACAAALATVDLLEEGLTENAARVGRHLQKGLRDLASRYDAIGDVRGMGLMVGAEIVRDRESKEPHAALRDTLVQQCFHRGLLLLGCGASTLRFCPPLVVDEEEANTAVSILDAALSSLG